VQSQLSASDAIVASYFELFVNRRAYTVQSWAADPRKGRCHYFRPKGRISLSKATVRSHLEGRITIGLYAINPETQRCKWVAIDADYSNALEDLLKLQWELRRDGVEAALEKSRRGGHLWIFAERPLLARECRIYIHNLARRVRVPIRGASSEPGEKALCEGIEVFPKQDEIPSNEFGNALRGPLGVHRGVGKRYWFYGADCTLEAQMAYLHGLKRLTEAEIVGFVAGLKSREEPVPGVRPAARRSVGNGNAGRPEFSILKHISGKKRRSGQNYFTRCPSCARQGRDKGGDNLAISVTDPRKYKCWAGCGKEEIRAALGCDSRTRKGSTA
jgi:hypothetical protein